MTELLAQIHEELRILNRHLAVKMVNPACLVVRFWSLLAALMAMTLGLLLLIGKPTRISANAYWGLSTFGGSQGWGMAFFITALFTLLAVWQVPSLLRWTVLLQAIPYAGLSAAFIISAFRYEDANLTAGPTYGWIAVMLFCLSDQARRCLRT